MIDSTISVSTLGLIITSMIGITAIVSNIFTSKNTIKHDEKNVLWAKVVEVDDKVDSLEKEIGKNYYTSTQIKEFIELTSQPVLQNLKHIEEQLSSIQNTVEQKVDTDRVLKNILDKLNEDKQG